MVFKGGDRWFVEEVVAQITMFGEDRGVGSALIVPVGGASSEPKFVPLCRLSSLAESVVLPSWEDLDAMQRHR